jgi:molybdopterin synthase catalytic subunit
MVQLILCVFVGSLFSPCKYCCYNVCIGQRVIELQYEAYIPMAIKQMKLVCKNVRIKWAIHRIAMFHRLGTVPVKDASVIIAISAVHRKEAIDAVSYSINTLKAQVPIWKKEVYENGEEMWKENKECFWTADQG